MPLNIGGKMNVDGIHASGNAKIEESASSGGKKEVKFNNDTNVGKSVEIGGIHTTDNAIVTHKGGLQQHEIKETDKTINIKENLNVDMKRATDDSKIIDRSQDGNSRTSRVFAEPQYQQKC